MLVRFLSFPLSYLSGYHRRPMSVIYLQPVAGSSYQRGRVFRTLTPSLSIRTGPKGPARLGVMLFEHLWAIVAGTDHIAKSISVFVVVLYSWETRHLADGLWPISDDSLTFHINNNGPKSFVSGYHNVNCIDFIHEWGIMIMIGHNSRSIGFYGGSNRYLSKGPVP